MGKGLDYLVRKTENKEIMIKPADKRSIIVIMSPDYYSNICQSHIWGISYYRILKLKEYNYLTKSTHKFSNLYMLPKLHKNKRTNEIIEKQQSEYINIEENIIVEACPILAGPICHTSGKSEILHIIMEPSLAMISHIA